MQSELEHRMLKVILVILAWRFPEVTFNHNVKIFYRYLKFYLSQKYKINHLCSPRLNVSEIYLSLENGHLCFDTMHYSLDLERRETLDNSNHWLSLWSSMWLFVIVVFNILISRLLLICRKQRSKQITLSTFSNFVLYLHIYNKPKRLESLIWLLKYTVTTSYLSL